MEENKNNSMQSSNQGQTQTQASSTNGLAIASLITGLLGLNVLAIIFGFIALNQIKKTGQGGKGMAIAGIILGFATLVIGLIIIIWITVFVSAVSSDIIRTVPQTQNELNSLFNEINGVQGNFNVTTP